MNPVANAARTRAPVLIFAICGSLFCGASVFLHYLVRDERIKLLHIDGLQRTFDQQLKAEHLDEASTNLSEQASRFAELRTIGFYPFENIQALKLKLHANYHRQASELESTADRAESGLKSFLLQGKQNPCQAWLPDYPAAVKETTRSILAMVCAHQRHFSESNLVKARADLQLAETVVTKLRNDLGAWGTIASLNTFPDSVMSWISELRQDTAQRIVALADLEVSRILDSLQHRGASPTSLLISNVQSTIAPEYRSSFSRLGDIVGKIESGEFLNAKVLTTELQLEGTLSTRIPSIRLHLLDLIESLAKKEFAFHQGVSFEVRRRLQRHGSFSGINLSANDAFCLEDGTRINRFYGAEAGNPIGEILRRHAAPSSKFVVWDLTTGPVRATNFWHLGESLAVAHTNDVNRAIFDLMPSRHRASLREKHFGIVCLVSKEELQFLGNRRYVNGLPGTGTSRNQPALLCATVFPDFYPIILFREVPGAGGTFYGDGSVGSLSHTEWFSFGGWINRFIGDDFGEKDLNFSRWESFLGENPKLIERYGYSGEIDIDENQHYR